LQYVAVCGRVLQCAAVCCSLLQRVAACCSAISHMWGGRERAGETGRECEEMTDTKRDRGKKIEREWAERKERDKEREGDRDQSVACTRSISTCSNKLYKSLFICQSLSATPTSSQQLTLVPAHSSRCTSSVSPFSAASSRLVSFSCATVCCSVLQCVAVRCSEYSV